MLNQELNTWTSKTSWNISNCYVISFNTCFGLTKNQQKRHAWQCLPSGSQSRRWLCHSPPGSSWVGVRICIPRQSVNKCPSGTGGTLPVSAILYLVLMRCLMPCRRQQGARLPERTAPPGKGFKRQEKRWNLAVSVKASPKASSVSSAVPWQDQRPGLTACTHRNDRWPTCDRQT